jgi:hypothetical protein
MRVAIADAPPDPPRYSDPSPIVARVIVEWANGDRQQDAGSRRSQLCSNAARILILPGSCHQQNECPPHIVPGEICRYSTADILTERQ